MGSTIVRPPTAGEIHRAAEIGRIAFNAPSIDPWINSFTWVANHYGLDFLIVVEVDGRIVSSMICTPSQARFGDDILPLCAVGGVATLPEHRKSGLAGMMMEESVRVLRRNGYHTSALWPFSYHYYRKFGWELGSEHRRYLVPSEWARDFSVPTGVRPARKSDIPAIGRLLERFGRRHNCVSVRDGLWWDYTLTSYGIKFDSDDDLRVRHGVCVHETGDRVDGYAFYMLSGEGETEVVAVREMVADSSRARSAILSRLAETGAPNISFRVPIDDDFLQALPDPRLVRTEIEGGFQFRVVDPLPALELRTVGSEIRGRIGFDIDDPTLGVSELDVDVEDGRIRRASGRADDRLAMSVQTFAQAFSGYITPSKAAELGRVEATSRRALQLADSVFAGRIPFRSHLEVG